MFFKICEIAQHVAIFPSLIEDIGAPSVCFTERYRMAPSAFRGCTTPRARDRRTGRRYSVLRCTGVG